MRIPKHADELPKGTRVLLSYGAQDGDLAQCDDYDRVMQFFSLERNSGAYMPWEAELLDNKKGTIRNMRVFGWEDEIGDTYAHKIVAYKDDNGKWQPVLLSDKQKEMKELEEAALDN